jgi:lipoprotein-anchoring transpeptidase ErfK/SrfK
MTKAAVTGRKNSAPARSANGSATRSPTAADQRQRRKQPVALGGEGFGDHAHIVSRRMRFLLVCRNVHRRPSYLPQERPASAQVIATKRAQSRCLGVTQRRLILRRIAWLTAGAALIAASACNVNINDNAAQAEQDATTQMSPQEQARQAQLAQIREQARGEFRDLRIVVDKSDREVRLFNGDRLLRTERVAIGQSEHPTPTGSWEIHQVDINPEWIPPDSEWAEDRERKAPGDPENPMGRARLIFKSPYSIHGTDDMESLGTAVPGAGS